MTNQLAVFKALAKADRIKIMELLAEPIKMEIGAVFYADGLRRYSVLEIARHIQLSQSQTSQHLATLRRAGLIIAQRSGNTILNSINPMVNWPVKMFK